MPSPARFAVSRVLAAATVAALIITGCGSGNGGGGTTTTSVTRPPVSTTVPPPGQLQLQSIVAQPTDLPTGWAARPAGPFGDPIAQATAFAQCVGATDTSADAVATADSLMFVKGTSFITSTATSFKAPADVQGDTSALSNPKASACFVQTLKARLTAGLLKGATVKSATVKVTPGPGTGPTNVVATAKGTIAFTSGGKAFTLNDDIVFFTAPRVEAEVDFFTFGSPVPVAVKTPMLAKVSARVQNGS